MGRVHFPLWVLCRAAMGPGSPVSSKRRWRAREVEHAGAAGEHPQGWGAAGGMLGEGKGKKKQ